MASLTLQGSFAGNGGAVNYSRQFSSDQLIVGGPYTIPANATDYVVSQVFAFAKLYGYGFKVATPSGKTNMDPITCKVNSVSSPDDTFKLLADFGLIYGKDASGNVSIPNVFAHDVTSLHFINPNDYDVVLNFYLLIDNTP